MSIEDEVEDIQERLSKIEDCLKSSDTFEELKACIKPMSSEETRKAFGQMVPMRDRAEDEDTVI